MKVYFFSGIVISIFEPECFISWTSIQTGLSHRQAPAIPNIRNTWKVIKHCIYSISLYLKSNYIIYIHLLSPLKTSGAIWRKKIIIVNYPQNYNSISRQLLKICSTIWFQDAIKSGHWRKYTEVFGCSDEHRRNFLPHIQILKKFGIYTGRK